MAAILEYDGSAFRGWQNQSHAPCGQLPVEAAFSRVADDALRVVCAGRTDAGVHAAHQVVHFDALAERTETQWRRGANANLPETITVRLVKAVADDFHARYSAVARHYTYLILNRAERTSILRNLVYRHPRPLDADAMHRAAQALVGKRDFSSFRAAECSARTPVRHLRAISVSRDGEYIVVKVCANAFLQHMVRNIVGALLDIGEGERGEDYIGDLLARCDRSQGSPTAPPQGLYLSGVEYPERYKLPTTGDAYQIVSQAVLVGA